MDNALAIGLLTLAVGVVGVVVAILALVVGRPVLLDWWVKRSQRRFREARKLLRDSRVPLSSAAGRLYPFVPPRNLPLLFETGWLPRRPLGLESVVVSADAFERDCAPLIGLGRSLPYTAAHTRYVSYADAVEDLDRPSEFANRACYRLTSVEPGDTAWRLHVTKTHYFDMLNSCEAVGFEFAASSIDRRKAPRAAKNITRLSSPRRAAGGPFELERRCVVPGINTLTIRSDGADTGFFMHYRQISVAEPDSVATAMGTNHVAPAGEFQPAGIDPTNFAKEADIWRTIVREYAEEFLQHPEAAGRSGATIDYDKDEPYSRINKARKTKGCWVRFLGLGVDPLSLKAEVLTVCVFKADVFDKIFRKALRAKASNAEGTLLTGHDFRGIPFDLKNVETFTCGVHKTLPAGAACLALAWQWRDQLMSPDPSWHQSKQR
jgi:hypothetical protein